MPPRIKRDAEELRDQISDAITAAAALGPGWPAGAPSAAVMTTARDNLAASITDTDAKEDAWKVAAQLKRTRIDVCIAHMKGVDEATDMLYGPSGAQKNSFGLTPKGAGMPPLHQLLEIEVSDGLIPGSLFFDWESIRGASYEVQWATDSGFTAVVGSAASASASEFMVSGLTPGTQYWLRVRPHRGGQTAPWSDPATRIAPV